jgi:SNF2 family DNA or RNA helicase
MEMAGIHLPPVTYLKRYYEMFPEQRRMYDELRATYRTEFEDGVEIEAEAAITRLLRLQQIICGYVGTGPGEPIRRISEKENPRLDLALDILEDLPHQVLIWCKFLFDCKQLSDALGKQALRYDGTVDSDGREYAKKSFQAGDIKYLIMTDAGAEGLTLVGAKTSMHYSSNFSMTKRLQKEARNVRIGQTSHTDVIDLICQGTVDNDIIDALRNKYDIASQLTGDKLKSWI